MHCADYLKMVTDLMENRSTVKKEIKALQTLLIETAWVEIEFTRMMSMEVDTNLTSAAPIAALKTHKPK